MKILAIDPGKVTGLAFVETDSGFIYAWQIDSRQARSKEEVTERVTANLRRILYEEFGPEQRIDVVAEDFTLRHGQAVDTTPLHTLGAIDELTDYTTYKYSPAAHKSGNKAYNISKMLKNTGITLDGDHKTDAMSLALHHWKIIDTQAAMKVLQEIKK